MRLGLISDTHGLLRPEVFTVFEGVDHIVHAGDVGALDILTELEALAPVTAVWGNTDGWEVRQRLPEVARVTLGGVEVVVVHGQQFGSPTPQRVAAVHEGGLVVFGHSHRPLIETVADALVVNPGSAGPRRFRDPITVALATIDDRKVEAKLVTLLPTPG